MESTPPPGGSERSSSSHFLPLTTGHAYGKTFSSGGSPGETDTRTRSAASRALAPSGTAPAAEEPSPFLIGAELFSVLDCRNIDRDSKLTFTFRGKICFGWKNVHGGISILIPGKPLISLSGNGQLIFEGQASGLSVAMDRKGSDLWHEYSAAFSEALSAAKNESIRTTPAEEQLDSNVMACDAEFRRNVDRFFDLMGAARVYQNFLPLHKKQFAILSAIAQEKGESMTDAQAMEAAFHQFFTDEEPGPDQIIKQFFSDRQPKEAAAAAVEPEDQDDDDNAFTEPPSSLGDDRPDEALEGPWRNKQFQTAYTELNERYKTEAPQFPADKRKTILYAFCMHRFYHGTLGAGALSQENSDTAFAAAQAFGIKFSRAATKEDKEGLVSDWKRTGFDQPPSYDPEWKKLPGERLLREFDLLDLKESSPSAETAQQLSGLTRRIRAVGRRRPEEWVNRPSLVRTTRWLQLVPGHSFLDTLRREAKFLGISEVEYKKLLCQAYPELKQTSDAEQSKGETANPRIVAPDGFKPRDQRILPPTSIESQTVKWEKQINDEERIAQLLQKPSLDRADIVSLVCLLPGHPPLSHPEWVAKLYQISQTCDDEEAKIICAAIKNAATGVNSRRMNDFIYQTYREIQKQDPAIHWQAVVNLFSVERMPGATFATPEEERENICRAIDLDIQTKALALDDKKDLIELRRIVSEWTGENPKYYHSASNYMEKASDSIFVRGGGGTPSEYSGAFVGLRPMPNHGPCCFAFSDSLDTMGKNIVTADWIADDEFWFGSNRAIPVNAQAQAFRKRCWEQIFSSIEPPSNLSPIEQKAFKASIMLWLENWTTLAYSEASGWQLAVRTPPGTPPNPKYAETLDTDQRRLLDLLKSSLLAGFPQCADAIQAIHLPPIAPKRPHSPDLAAAAPTSLCGVFVDVRSGTPVERVQKELFQLGISVPVYPLKMGTLWARYAEKVKGVRLPPRAESTHTRLDIGKLPKNPKQPYF